MPLKLKPPRKSPYWSVKGSYLGIRIDRSSKTSKRAVAAKVLKQIEREIERGEFAEKGEPTFASAAKAYMMAGGERTYLSKLLEHFGDKPLKQIDQAAIDSAAAELYPVGTAATRNRQVYTPVSAILQRAGILLRLRRPNGSNGTKSTAWLWPEQAFRLFDEAEKIDKRFAALIITLCYTGMRLSEALNLTWNDVRLQDGFAYLPDTKNDTPRAVFLPEVAVAEMASLPGDRTGSSRAFGFRKSGHLYSLLKAAAAKADVELPERSAFHIFRHTYATWMRREAGLDTRGLVGTGAWRDAKSAARYSHVVVSEESRKAVMLPVRKIGGNGG